MSPDLDLVGAIDLGGTNVRAAIVDSSGQISGYIHRPTEGERGPDAVIDRVVDTLDGALDAAGRQRTELAGIGIGAPGPLDWRSGVIKTLPNLPGWRDVPLAVRISGATGCPVFVENDANAAALAEYTYGAHAGERNMVYITVSTGVGGGLILDGALWHGIYGSAGEVGHMTVDFEGPVCSCGSRGCVEAIASGPDMARWMEGKIRAGDESSLRAKLDSGQSLTGRDVVEAAQTGDGLALATLDRAGRAVGFAIVNVTHLLNLELAVVGGGIANAGDLLLGPIRRTVEDNVIYGTADDLHVEPWSLGENVGLLGAAASVRSRLSEA